MKADELLYQLLGVEAPWQIVQIRGDLGKDQIDVWIAQQTGRSGWFFGSKPNIPPGQEQVWRHINLGNSRCVIHSVVSTSAPPWNGQAGQPFTHAMAQLVGAMMRDGIKLQSICAILDITVADLWKFKHSLDSGKAGLADHAPAAATESEERKSRVADQDDPIWLKLLDGAVNIDIRLLSLKFLMTKLREQIRHITDDEVRTLKAYELHRFVVRHEQMLDHELSQLAKL